MRNETGGPFFNQESTNPFIGARPDDCNIRNTSVCEPAFRAVQNPTICIANCAREHSSGVRSEIRLSQSKASDLTAGCKLRQPLFFLFLRSECVNGIHD